MEDRIAQKPGRFKITPEDEASMPFYAKVTAADSATVQGTPLDKETLLSDMVADALGLDRKTATPTQAFMALVQLINRIRPRKDILYSGQVAGPNGSTKALQLSGRMEDYDILLFRAYATGLREGYGVALYPAPNLNNRLPVAQCDYPEGNYVSESGWTIWHKFPSGFFALNATEDDFNGYAANYRLFDPSEPAQVTRLKFTGNHVYLTGNTSAVTDVEVVGYNLSGGA